MPSVAIIGTRGYPSYYGGFETSVRKLAPYLVDAGWEVTVYGRPGTEEGDPDRDSRVRTKTTRGIETKSLSTLSYGASAVLDAVRQKPDVALVMNCANGYWLPALKARGIPTLVNVDGIEWERGKWNRIAKAVFYGGAKMTALFANRLVFDAEAIAAYWQDKFRRDGDFIAYGGDSYPQLPVEPGLTDGAYALVVARFVAENTLGEFVRAAEKISKDHDVVFVGSSGYGGEIEETVAHLAATNPRVHWFGHIKDDLRLASLWQHAGAYFHGHSVGGTNPALVQAMALGAPIVARDTSYNREVLGEAGRLVSATAEDIAGALEHVLSDRSLRQRLSTRAQARAAEAYTWEGVCAGYEAALRKLVKLPAALPPDAPVASGPRNDSTEAGK